MIRVQYSDDVRVDGIKCLVYGQFGIGKTPLCSTAPLPIIFSAEQGLLSIRRTHTPFIEINGYASLVEAYNWAASSAEARNYFTFCLDSLSEIAEVCLNEEKRKSKDPRQAYGAVIDQVVMLARAFRDLPGKSVVLVAKEEYSKDEATNINLYQPMMPGTKLGMKLPYFFDEVFRMVIYQTNWRALATKSTYQHTARDRSGMLDEHERPDLTYIFRKILGI